MKISMISPTPHWPGIAMDVRANLLLRAARYKFRTGPSMVRTTASRAVNSLFDCRKSIYTAVLNRHVFASAEEIAQIAMSCTCFLDSFLVHHLEIELAWYAFSRQAPGCRKNDRALNQALWERQSNADARNRGDRQSRHQCANQPTETPRLH
jgi:hypothetical protein